MVSIEGRNTFIEQIRGSSATEPAYGFVFGEEFELPVPATIGSRSEASQ